EETAQKTKRAPPLQEAASESVEARGAEGRKDGLGLHEAKFAQHLGRDRKKDDREEGGVRVPEGDGAVEKVDHGQEREERDERHEGGVGPEGTGDQRQQREVQRREAYVGSVARCPKRVVGGITGRPRPVFGRDAHVLRDGSVETLVAGRKVVENRT